MTQPSALAVGLAAALVVVALSGSSRAGPGGASHARPGPTSTQPPRNDPKALAVSGHVEALYPGAHTTLTVSIANPNPFAVRISSLRVEADDAGPTCPAAVITLDPPPIGAMVPAKGTESVSVGIGMVPTAPDACQAATFPLHYFATGSKAK